MKAGRKQKIERHVCKDERVKEKNRKRGRGRKGRNAKIEKGGGIDMSTQLEKRTKDGIDGTRAQRGTEREEQVERENEREREIQTERQRERERTRMGLRLSQQPPSPKAMLLLIPSRKQCTGVDVSLCSLSIRLYSGGINVPRNTNIHEHVDQKSNVMRKILGLIY